MAVGQGFRAAWAGVALAATLAASGAGGPLSAGARGAPRPIEREYLRLAPIADSLARGGPGKGIAFVDSVARHAATRQDRALLAAARLWRGIRHGVHEYDFARSEPDFAAALEAARALSDTFALATAHTRRAHAAQLAGRPDRSQADYREAVRLARRARLGTLEGFAHRGLGFIAKNDGRYPEALRELDDALRLLPESSFEHLHSRFLRAEVLNRTGRRDDAREEFQAVLDEAHRRGNRWLMAAALNDLGIVAFEQGDMADADRRWEIAAAHFDTLAMRNADRGGAINARINRAHALVVLGRHDEARALLERLVEVSGQLDDPNIQVGALGELGVLLRRAGRPAQAERVLRSVRAAAAAHDAQAEEAASVELAGLLRETGRLEATLALTDSLLAPARRARLTPDNAAAALLERGAARRARGETAAALADVREAERLSRGPGGRASIYWLDAVTELGRTERAAGQVDRAVATLARGARAWERWRAGISDLEWRERAGSGLAGLFAEYGLALLDARRGTAEARRVREAFDALQAFQARTLEERMQGAGLAGRAMAGRLTADSLRRGVLGRGEVVLDLVATPETTFAFVVSRTGAAVRLLPGTRRLDGLFRDWRGAMLRGADAATAEAGLARLSAELLSPLAEPLRGSRRIVVTGGGPVLLWPIGALILPGEAAPLDATREIVAAPSATLFALLRARAGTGRDGPRLLAVGRTTDPDGRELPGAERELAMLDRTFDRVTVRRNRGDRSVREVTADLGRFDALHLAGHSDAPEAAPWRSGFLLGRGGGESAYLRASTVARMKLSARLAVLSGCQSAGGAGLAGEGAIGMTSAFLCAGTTTVIATLWPVDDRAAELYMTAFYAALARREPAGAAARQARAALRARPDTAHPRDWAAFVLVGEPGTRLALPARGSS